MGVCASKPDPPQRGPVGIKDFTLVKLVGRGGFADVLAARKNDTRVLYAAKRIAKRRVIVVCKATGKDRHTDKQRGGEATQLAGASVSADDEDNRAAAHLSISEASLPAAEAPAKAMEVAAAVHADSPKSDHSDGLPAHEWTPLTPRSPDQTPPDPAKEPSSAADVTPDRSASTTLASPSRQRPSAKRGHPRAQRIQEGMEGAKEGGVAEEEDQCRLSHTVWTERDVLSRTRSPFLTRLRWAFQDEDHLYLVMPYLSGGDLRHVLDQALLGGRARAGLPEALVRFHMCELILALEHLHGMGIVYRDVKPRNLLLDHKGHLCLADYGLCKVLSGREGWLTAGKAGTPGFRAPEVLQGGRYSFEVDFFSLGVTTFRLLTGKYPFGQNGDQFAKPITMRHASPQARSFVEGLLRLDVRERLGARKMCEARSAFGGHLTPPPIAESWADIKAHEFLAGVDWDMLARHKVKPPWRPKQGAFSNMPKKIKPSKAIKNEGLVLTEKHQKLFEGFECTVEP